MVRRHCKIYERGAKNEKKNVDFGGSVRIAYVGVRNYGCGVGENA